jgi:two-component system NarL family sensor kinase
MEESAKDIIFFITTVTVVILMFVVLVVGLLLVSRNRRLKHANQILEMNASFQSELNTTKHEVMEQVFSDVASELHDNVGQTLTHALLTLNRTAETTPGPVTETREIIRQVMQEIRELSHRLSPDYWKQFNLEQSLSILEKQIQRSGLKAEFRIAPEVAYLDSEREILIFRVIQELIQNTLKHSGAGSITLQIWPEADHLAMVYSDNGKGIPADHDSKGLGMRSINTRMQLCNATSKIISESGGGFVFEAHIPITTTHGEN